MAFQLSSEYEALKHDINSLFLKFHQRQSVRFEDYCEEWKAVNFSCIFGATHINTQAAKMRIVERLFRVTSEFLSEECTFLYRVAAVYTFYAVYFKQITQIKVKIRMTPTMWNDLLEFLKVVKEHHHLDVAYIIDVLRKHRAFTFCAFPKEISFGKLEFMLGIEGTAGFRHTQETDTYINDLFNTSNLQNKLSNIQNDYDEVKERLLCESKEDEKPDLSKVLFYSNSEFPEELSKMLVSHKRKYVAGSSVRPNSTDSIQRPVLSQLHQLGNKSKNDGHDSEQASKVHTLSKFKEKLWSADIKNSSGRRFAAPESVKEDPKEKEEQQDKSTFYKKSAMLQPMVKRVRQKKNRPGLRFKLHEGPHDEDM